MPKVARANVVDGALDAHAAVWYAGDIGANGVVGANLRIGTHGAHGVKGAISAHVSVQAAVSPRQLAGGESVRPRRFVLGPLTDWAAGRELPVTCRERAAVRTLNLLEGVGEGAQRKSS